MRLGVGVITALATCAVHATTLQKLTTDDMIRKSSAIVRATVTGSHTVARGLDIYTYYQFTVTETLKAGPAQIREVAVPGGAMNGMRQLVAGAPAPQVGKEYVIFLWTGRSGAQVMGLSQGMFAVMQNDSNESVLTRGPADGLMLDASGRVVSDQGVSMKLSDLRGEIKKVLGQ